MNDLRPPCQHLLCPEASAAPCIASSLEGSCQLANINFGKVAYSLVHGSDPVSWDCLPIICPEDEILNRHGGTEVKLKFQTWGVSAGSCAPLGTLCNCCGFLDSGRGEHYGTRRWTLWLVLKAAGGKSSTPWLSVRCLLGIHSHVGFSEGKTYAQIATVTLGKMIEILSYSLTVYLNAGW